MRYPISTSLQNHHHKNPISFHVPGHKYGLVGGVKTESRDTLLKYDVTELTGLDDFHSPTDAINESIKRLEKIYSSKGSYYLVNGSTVGNLAMILATCRAGDKIIVPRNAHKSVINAVELADAQPIFVQPERDIETGTYVGISVEMIKEVRRTFDVSACLLTYPSYYGQIFDIKAVIDYCHDHNMVVLVDEAHGAHLLLNELFPPSALALGADIVVQSAHKTLPSLTMTSWLHVGSSRVNIVELERYLSMLQSSSPSYLFLQSLENAMEFVYDYTEKKEYVEHFFNGRKIFLNNLQQTTQLTFVEMDDPLKIYVQLNGYSGYELQSILEQVGIFGELGDAKGVLWILPLQWSATYLEECIGRVKLLKPKNEENIMEERKNIIDFPSVSTIPYTYKDLKKLEIQISPIDKALGSVVAEPLIPYPPGIPLVQRGERLTEEIGEEIQSLIKSGVHVQGITSTKHVKVFSTI
ncbi:aminotransferase class I/II-fold pyridoxal phosphate-dependent enzyme [Mangrovibacillus cuniculi]|uniref:Aminotransferase class V-fold PLP-dependent enzyme n=1 Tax=Mangrovibacillus cuniculi TaxID=2593652 RepID=A0A7S8CDF1_9BACI|nr:aminotransferase class V-fold PLP-dependent enzyme [Mangrovibacillus cuniculi]QPC47955.1 aminotransferase class V-fold PLP-dependent enzyme [Mangrovibacillus cuniculi]